MDASCGAGGFINHMFMSLSETVDTENTLCITMTITQSIQTTGTMTAVTLLTHTVSQVYALKHPATRETCLVGNAVKRIG